MRTQLDIHGSGIHRGTTYLTEGFALAGITLLVFSWAGAARAGDDFEAGFKYELGRVTAHHVAAVGHLLLFGFHTQPVIIREHHRDYRPQRHHRPRWRHVQHYDRHHQDRHYQDRHVREHRRSRHDPARYRDSTDHRRGDRGHRSRS